ncbi:hypothetical protein Aperf_G00000069518 [Anoplocephala perfoliata]
MSLKLVLQGEEVQNVIIICLSILSQSRLFLPDNDKLESLQLSAVLERQETTPDDSISPHLMRTHRTTSSLASSALVYPRLPSSVTAAEVVNHSSTSCPFLRGVPMGVWGGGVGEWAKKEELRGLCEHTHKRSKEIEITKRVSEGAYAGDFGGVEGGGGGGGGGGGSGGGGNRVHASPN